MAAPLQAIAVPGAVTTNSPDVPVQGQHTISAAAMTGNAMADALQGFQSGIQKEQQAQDLNDRTQLRLEDEQARTWAGNAIAQAHVDLAQMMQDQASKAEPGAPDFTGNYLKSVDDYFGKMMANAPNDPAKRYVQREAASLRGTVGQTAVAYQAQQWKAEQDRQGLKMGEDSGIAVANDPNSYDGLKANITSTITDPKTRDAALKTLRDSAAIAAVQRDPVGSASLIRGVTFGIGPGESAPTSVPHYQSGPAVEKFAPQINAAAQKYGVDPGLLGAQLWQESRGDISAQGPETSTGDRSIGIAQFQPATARQYGVDPTDANSSIDGQAHYMSDLLKKYDGDTQKALAAYNWGPGNLDKAIAAKGDNWRSALPAETSDYIQKITGGDTGTADGTGASGRQVLVPAWLSDMPVADRLHYLDQANGLAARQGETARATLERQVNDHYAAAEVGQPPQRQLQLPDFTSAFGQADGTRRYQDYSRQMQLGSDLSQLSTMSTADISDLLTHRKSEVDAQAAAGQDGTYNALHRLGTLQEAAQRTVQQRQVDPIGYAQQSGQFGLKPLDFNNKQNFQNGLKDRVAAASAISQKFSTPPVILSKQEATAVSRSLDLMTPDQQVGFFGELHGALNDDGSYRSFMQQITPDDPVRANAGVLANTKARAVTNTHWFGPDDTTSAQDVAATILKGQAILNPTKGLAKSDGKPVTALYTPPDADLQQAFAQAAGLAFIGRPQAAEVAYQTARAYYVGRASELGQLSGDKKSVDTDLMDQATRLTLGNRISQAGGDIFAPWGMDSATFKDKAQAAAGAAFKANGLPSTGTDLFGGALTLRQVTGNTYQVMAGNAYMPGKDKRPIVITVQ